MSDDANGASTALPALADEQPAGQLAAWGTGGGIAWLAEYERMSRAVAGAITLPKAIREAGGPREQAATVLAMALMGREWGLGFMQSTLMFDVIEGKVTPSARLVVGRARELGHEIVPMAKTHGAVRVTCKTCELPEAEQVEWALTRADAFTQDAVIASEIMVEHWGERRGERVQKPLTDKGGAWLSYPHDMLFWRAALELIRRHCPQATGGMYAREELE